MVIICYLYLESHLDDLRTIVSTMFSPSPSFSTNPDQLASRAACGMFKVKSSKFPKLEPHFQKFKVTNFAKWKMTTLEPHFQKFQIVQCRITFPKVKDDNLGASLLVTGVPRLRQTLCCSNVTENIFFKSVFY